LSKVEEAAVITQLVTMLELQDAMNTKVNQYWRQQGFAWYRAIWVECAELMDHYGWKWWKKQTPDEDQVKLELVDIWHFGLSILLLESTDDVAIAKRIAPAMENCTAGTDFRGDLEDFTLATLATKQFDVARFAVLMADVGMSFGELYTRYVGKNVLNFFRQDNGYQDGTYRKQWSGKEDNEHLVEAVASLDPASPGFKDDLYQALDLRYRVGD
jgi:dimeric dUTPase (all-alpha-NTP-PPase superfamily)